LMPEAAVLATWPWFPMLTDAAGGGWSTWMPVCAGATRGEAQFHGGVMTGVWFTSGATTDAGISIGSSLNDLRPGYGASLDVSFGSSAYYVYASGPPPVATLGFEMHGETVTAIGFGGRQDIGRSHDLSIWC